MWLRKVNLRSQEATCKHLHGVQIVVSLGGGADEVFGGGTYALEEDLGLQIPAVYQLAR